MLDNRSDAEQLFNSYQSHIIRCFEDAWDEYHDDTQYSPVQRGKHGKRTNANIINDLMVHRAYTVFKDVEGVTFIRRHGYLHLDFRGQALVRLKKLDRRRRPSNIQTKSVKALNSPTATIDGLPPAARRLVAGYQEDALGELTAIFIVAPVGLKNAYEIPVKIYGEPTGTLFNVREITPQPDGGETQVRGKSADTLKQDQSQ